MIIPADQQTMWVLMLHNIPYEYKEGATIDDQGTIHIEEPGMLDVICVDTND